MTNCPKKRDFYSRPEDAIHSDSYLSDLRSFQLKLQEMRKEIEILKITFCPKKKNI